jgi:hypothetical protein
MNKKTWLGGWDLRQFYEQTQLAAASSSWSGISVELCSPATSVACS